MKVIITENIEKLGRKGDVKDVKPGYARNYLFPNNYAMAYTPGNVKVWAQRFKAIEKEEDKLREIARGLSAKLDGTAVAFEVKAGEEGKLFGSVTSQMIADALEEKGHTISRKDIALDAPIKELGVHEVQVKFHMDVAATVTVDVLREGGEPEGGPEAEPEAAEAESGETSAEGTQEAPEAEEPPPPGDEYNDNEEF